VAFGGTDLQCDLDRISVHFVRLGEGIPLLGLHGMGGDHTEMLFELEPLLSKRGGWQRIYLDLPGHGRTPGADWITSIAQVFELLSRFVEAVLGDARFVVAGSSYGAYMAQGLVHRFGGRLDGLWMNVPAVTYPRANRVRPARTVIREDAKARAEMADAGASWYSEIAVADGPAVCEYARAIAAGATDQAFLSGLDETGSWFQGQSPPEPLHHCRPFRSTPQPPLQPTRSRSEDLARR